METYVRDPTLIGLANDTTTPAVTKVEKPAGAEAGTTKVQNVSAGGRLAWGKMGSFGGAWGGDVVDLAWFSSD